MRAQASPQLQVQQGEAYRGRIWILGRNNGSGAGDGQAEQYDREGSHDVEKAVQLDRHDLIPFVLGSAAADALSDVDDV